MVENMFITFDKPLLLFFGEIRQGKSTILNAVRWVFGGGFPTDIIRHGQQNGCIQLDFDGGYVRREFYRAADGESKCRPLVLVQNDKRIPRPVDALRALLNPFLLDQDYLVKMTELERKKYFAELFHTATPELDAEKTKASDEASILRVEVKTYGDIQPVQIAKVDPTDLRNKLVGIHQTNKNAVANWERLKAEVTEHNDNVAEAEKARAEWSKHIAERETTKLNLLEQIKNIEKDLKVSEVERKVLQDWLGKNAMKELPAPPVQLPTTELENAIMDAGAQNVRAEQFERDRVRLAEKQTKERRIAELETRLLAIRNEKIAKLAEIEKKAGIVDLKFDPDGGFTFEDTQAGMLSTSQLMRLSATLQSLYAESVNLKLIDKAESLGQSIMDFVKQAQAEEKTILATIVGERPAVVPENIGVFVVKDGKLS
jgi:DNA repair exonuclease SbcCD ATPase subunit